MNLKKIHLILFLNLVITGIPSILKTENKLEQILNGF